MDTPSNKATVCLQIRPLRERAGLTRSELAARMGVSRPTAGDWDRGTKKPEAWRLPQLAAVLDCSLDELFGLCPACAQSAPARLERKEAMT